MELNASWIERISRAPLRASAVGPRSAAARYLLAILLSAATVAVTSAVPTLLHGAPFMASVGAVLVAGLVAGAGPALVALTVTTVALAALMPGEHLAPTPIAARLAAYWAVGAMVAAVAASARRTLERERAGAARERVAAVRIARLQSITAALADCGTPGEVAEVALAHGIDAAGAAAGRVSLLSDCGRELVVFAARGLAPAAGARGVRVARDAGVPSWDPLREGRAVFHADRAALAASHPAWAAEAAALGHEAWAGLPLRTPRATLGVLSLSFTEPRSFDEDEGAFLQSVADQCAQALERTRHAEREHAALERTRILLDAAGAFADAGTLPALFERIATAVSRRFDSGAFLGLLEPDGERIRIVAAFHPDPELREALEALLAADPTMPVEGSWFAGVASGGRSLLLPHVAPEELARASPVEAHRRFLGPHPVTSVLIAPIRAAGEVIGSLAATRHAGDGRPFTDDDRELLEELAARAGLAIVSARRHDELLSERRRLSEVLYRAESASRAKDEFLAMLSHELRNPLAPITTALHLMRLRGSDAFARERAILERQVRHLTELVDDLLDVSRVTQGKVRLQRRVIPLADAVARGVETASPMLEAREHALEVEVQPGLYVNADEHRLAQVISNLLVNAGKYTPRRGHVSLRASREGDQAVIVVRDDGIGVPRELLGRIFELFVQGERASDRAPGGLGLGLPIARSLVFLHGGTIRVESEGPGKGSVFTVELPAAERPEEPAVTPVPAAAERPAAARRRVLVVDDNRDAAELLAESVREAGEVRVAFDGPSALALLADFTPDVALLDLGLPVMDGFELARRIRALAPDATLIAVSGYGQDGDRRRSAEAGFAEHLVKPVDLPRLRALVRGDPAPPG